mmetsp:Transcript_91577/g.144742  ORF Transcript_91577/g.144742 Transcript_91577/m.144742 type:complete len:643 (+) Transcript_91577:70-1998(+)
MELFVEADSLAARKILATAKIAGLAVKIAGPSKGTTSTGVGIPELLHHPHKNPVRHLSPIMRRLAQSVDCGLLGRNFEDESVIDAWMDWASLDIDHVLRMPSATPDKLCDVLQSHLKNRTFLVGERLTIADISVAVSLQQGVNAAGMADAQKKFPATVRWLRTCIEHLQLPSAPAVGPATPGQSRAPQAKTEVTPKAAPKSTPSAKSTGAPKAEAKPSTPPAVAKVEARVPLLKKVPKMRLFASAESPAAKKILAAAKLIGLELQVVGASQNVLLCGYPAPELVIDGATPVKHTNAILRHLARLCAHCVLMGETLAEESQADAWLDWSALEVDHKLTVADACMDKFYKVLETHLKTRTFLVGERLTVADISAALSLQPAIEKTTISEAKRTYPSMVRWWLTCASQLNLATTATPVASLNSAVKSAKAEETPKAQAKGSSAPSKTQEKVATGSVTESTSVAPCWGEKLNAAPVKLFVEAGSSVAKRILVTAKRVGLAIDIAGASKSTTPTGLSIPELVSGDSKPVRHVNPILRHIAQLVPDCDLMGLSFTHEALVDAWLDWTIMEVDHIVACEGLSIDPFCQVLNAHLTSRTFLVGQALTLADIAVAVAVHSAIVKKGIDEVKKSYPALVRWLLTCAHQLELS